MNPGDYLQSANLKYTLTMQVGGNLALEQTGQPPPPLWQSGTASPNSTCKMLLSGDLVIYDANKNRLKHSATSGNADAFLNLDNNGVLSIETAGGAQLAPPWEDGPMYAFPLVTPALVLLGQLQNSVDKLRAHLVPAQVAVTLPQTALRTDDEGAVPASASTVGAAKNNGHPAAATPPPS
jgi:hypothetical protein